MLVYYGWWLVFWVTLVAALFLLIGSSYAYVDGVARALFWRPPLRWLRLWVGLATLCLVGSISWSWLLQGLVVACWLEYGLRRWSEVPAIRAVYPREWFGVLDVVRPLSLTLASVLLVISPVWMSDMSGYPAVRPRSYAVVVHGRYGLYSWPTGQWLWRWADPVPGEVVMVDDATSWVGRVVAVGRQTVAYRDNSFWLDRVRLGGRLDYERSLQLPGVMQSECLGDRCYRVWHLARVTEPVMAEQSLPEGAYFILSDNRSLALDSRVWGAVDKALIRGPLYAFSDLVTCVLRFLCL